MNDNVDYRLVRLANNLQGGLLALTLLENMILNCVSQQEAEEAEFLLQAIRRCLSGAWSAAGHGTEPVEANNWTQLTPEAAR